LAQRRAEQISLKWGERLDEFFLPCPLCRGELEFMGIRQDQLYEFAEGEPGAVLPLDIYSITFECNHCGYTAKFDSELFNPAYLARLAGAKPERVAELLVADFRAMVILRGNERGTTALDLASQLAGERRGEVFVIAAGSSQAPENLLEEKLQHYRPAPGDPAPVFLSYKGSGAVQDAIQRVLNGQSCNLLLLYAKGWSKDEETGIVSALNKIVGEEICDAGVIYDRGLKTVRRILLATAGGQGEKAAAPIAVDLAKAYDAELHLLYIASPGDPQGSEAGQRFFAETLGEVEIPETLRLKRRVEIWKDPTEAIIDDSNGFDLLILGGSQRRMRGQIGMDTRSAKIARNASVTTIVVFHQIGRTRSRWAWLLGR
jgi:nucleotide-binding universal stress UspA family protein